MDGDDIMTERKLYIGTVGPFIYDDADLINDADGDFSGIYDAGLTTDGVMRQEGAPTIANDNVRLQDISVGTGITAEDFRYMFMMGH
jgi:hypothetical protein